MNYVLDEHRGKDYFVCCGFTREFGERANDVGWKVGGISLRDHEHVAAHKCYHAMNYIVIDNKFIIIEPQTDQISYLNEVYMGQCKYRYITIFPDAQMMTNFGNHKETIDIDVLKEYNETELCEKWKL